MKKMMSILLSLLMLGGAVAMGENMEGEIVEPVIGRITEVWEDGSLILDTLQDTQVHVLISDDTAFESEWTPGEGDVVAVLYDGIMTRSEPPQINADTIQCYSLEGQVSEVNAEMNRVLVNSALSGQVWVSLPDGEKAEDYAGQVVRVYFNGIMALSFPAQTSAYTIETVVAVSGMITETAQDYFIMDGEEGLFRVNFSEQSKMPDNLEPETEVVVYYNGVSTRSIPPQIFGLVIAETTTVG